MAKVTLNPALTSIRGRLGNTVFRRTANGGTSLIKLADMSNVKWSPAQQAHRQRFKQASAYAKAALADPAVRAHYLERAAAENKRPYLLAISDYFKEQNLLPKE